MKRPVRFVMRLLAAVAGLWLSIGVEAQDDFIQIDIDIAPRSESNTLNAQGNGFIQVAILTNADFDASTVDPTSVQFGPGGAYANVNPVRFIDYDKDEDVDLILTFPFEDTGIICIDDFASLTGLTTSGENFMGSDAISMQCVKIIR